MKANLFIPGIALPIFRANPQTGGKPQSDELNISEKEMMQALRAGKIDPKLVNPKTGETIFLQIIRKNFLTVTSYLLAKPSRIGNVLNMPSREGVTPLDAASTDKMKQLLKSRGAKHYSELPQDARVTASKIFMDNPIIVPPSEVRPQKKDNVEPIIEQPAQPEPQTKKTANSVSEPQKQKKTDYFDSFYEVETEETTEETDTIQHTAESTQDKVSDEQIQTKSKHTEKREIPKKYRSYAMLEISPSDPQTIDEITGMDKLKADLKENVIIPLNVEKANEQLRANNIDIPNGILIETEEDITPFVKALSNETDMFVLQLFHPSELTTMIKDIEAEYKESGKKTIILMKGFDKFFTTGPACDLDKKNFLLSIENCSERGALLFATADSRCDIDKKFFDSRVFDKVIELRIPELQDRIEYLTQYFKNKPIFADLNNPEIISELGRKTEGFRYTDIEKVLEESARSAVSKQRETVDADIMRAELREFTEQAGIVPIDEFNRTTMFDTPEFKRVPVEPGEIMNLDDLGGMPEIKQKLRDLYVRPLQNIETLQQQIGSAAIPDGAIFYGPAGNGKTLTARVLARELGLPFYETKLSDIGTAFVHEEPKAFRKLAKQLNDKFIATGERSVWFLDEFDSIGSERSGSQHQHNKELVDTLLQELSNPASRGFILIAATNELDNVDSALKRRGRLGNWIGFTAPDFEARVDVIRKNLAATSFTQEFAQQEEVVNKLAKELDGLSMSSITAILGDAKRMAILNGKNFTDCIRTAVDTHIAREMGEFCTKAGLKPHQYNDWDFKTLDELGGMEEVKQALEENIIDVWDPQIRAMLIANRRSLPGGVILEGPPGTGKTTIIETLARQMGIPLYKMNYSQKGNEYIHGVARNVTEIFERLKLESKIRKTPVMLFFDEAEKFFPRHASGHQVEEVNTYKDLMNTASASGIILVAATNHIDLVNQEIIGNPRRMGTVIHVGNPNEGDRKNLLMKLLKDLPIITAPITDEIYQGLAQMTEGLSIGQISDGIDKFITQSIKKKQNIEPKNLLKAFSGKV